MKRILLSVFTALLLGASASAQGSITLTTEAEVGTTIKFLPNAVSATSPISIDFGDGNVKKYTVDPKLSDWQRWIEAEIKGSTITITGNLTELQMSDAMLTSAVIDGMNKLTTLDLSDNHISKFELLSIMPIEDLDLSGNKIINTPSNGASLTLECVGETLKRLNIANNEGLQCLDIRDLTALEDLQAYKCPDLASIFICMPEDSRENLRYLNLSECSLAHFYPVSLPSLTSLDLSGNLLMSEYDDEPFAMGDYPNLRNLTLSNNKGIHDVDVSACKYLEQLYVNGCGLSSIDVSACPELNTLNIADNKIKSVDLGNNKQLSVVLIQGNPFTEFDTSLIPNVSTLNISDTQISRVNLMVCPFLKSFKASNTKLEFVDFNGQQADRMTIIDLRNCPNFTAESMDYTIHTLPVARKAWSTNLYLKGSNAEKADTEYATSADMQWICDVTGDGSAEHSPLSLSFIDAEKTGEKKTGTLERLYPIFAMSLDYDLELMHTNGGDFVVAQWKPIYFQTIKDATDGTILKGVPVCVYTYPEEGKQFKSVTVNGKEIFSPWFIASEDAEVKVNFTDENAYISMTVTPGQEMSFRVNTTQNGASVWIDWGTGALTEYPGQRAYVTSGNELIGARIDGKASGSTVTVYGDLAGIDINGFGSVAVDFGLWDNHVTALDVTHAPGLKILTAYWNPLTSIDLSNCPELEVLDLSYTAIKTIDLSNCPNLMSLEAYSAGYEEDGIAPLSSIDLSKLPILQLLNLKGNGLSSIDITNNPYLRYVDLCNNNIASIDLSKNTIIEELNLTNNKLTTIDLKNLGEIYDLSLDGNELTSIDISKNTKLTTLMLGNNHFTDLDLSPLKELQTLYINGNGMDAEQINDVFYRLPKRIDHGDSDQGGMAPRWNLCLYQALDRDENDYRGHDSSIAEDRGWTPSHYGSNSGADVAYLDLISAIHGSYTVTDAAGNTIVHGSKVEKWQPLNIVATPDDGYKFYSYQLNDDEAVMGDPKFEMPGIYTKLRVNFAKGSGIDGVDADGCTIAAIAGGVHVTAPASTAVEVYTASGQLAANGCTAADGNLNLSLAPGFYIVKAAGNAKSVIVK